MNDLLVIAKDKPMNTVKKTFLTLALAGISLPVFAQDTQVELYKNPYCGCCDEYAKHLEANGFEVKLIDTSNMADIKQKYGVPEELEGCHTALVGNYVVEGLVPAEYVKSMLKQGGPIKGLSVPGMPVGAPGMPGAKKGPIHVYYLKQSSKRDVFATF
jgi:hypothetical protein